MKIYYVMRSVRKSSVPIEPCVEGIFTTYYAAIKFMSETSGRPIDDILKSRIYENCGQLTEEYREHVDLKEKNSMFGGITELQLYETETGDYHYVTGYGLSKGDGNDKT